MMNGYGSFWTVILMIIFWIGLISFGIFLIASFIKGDKKRTPLQIIKECLAKGEINELEYERLKSIIKEKKSNDLKVNSSISEGDVDS
ncbi:MULTISPECIES: SHOCT domain-containing protein [Oceanobacillus]|uniref:SHOCT domain-containing protein n=1 Tax=Oceanobacillus aidingensis TaxID=645964 RepID=A0ABV9JZJ2_9BACI|nr:SHOCT domain-containing protein [Oceanobacillus oncorhynchi]MDM8100593.1 SHOCT domain-containing protein [Oceanobacillus oncorhynchi]